ncbi:uncharacterized protein LOC129585511 isoform X2 [Paramacrobiotus metropolitanus]|uniref:uncharacterized protein LOC129585511 isoform X2 n=1 Tax=Paramacrobiotus metropolitanus TaxID=2943436 RepID=UPI0024462D8D|nr:uncharacterized protein LOC129585511 isoform X2 [Paramacrobiotus metropolitanus]
MSNVPIFEKTYRGGDVMILEGYEYLSDRRRNSSSTNDQVWRCRSLNTCTTRLHLSGDIGTLNKLHNHAPQRPQLENSSPANVKKRHREVIDANMMSRARSEHPQQRAHLGLLPRAVSVNQKMQSDQSELRPKPKKNTAKKPKTETAKKPKGEAEIPAAAFASDYDDQQMYAPALPQTIMHRSANRESEREYADAWSRPERSHSTTADARVKGSSSGSNTAPAEEKFVHYISALLKMFSAKKKRRYMQAIRKTIIKLDMEFVDDDSDIEMLE